MTNLTVNRLAAALEAKALRADESAGIWLLGPALQLRQSCRKINKQFPGLLVAFVGQDADEAGELVDMPLAVLLEKGRDLAGDLRGLKVRRAYINFAADSVGCELFAVCTKLAGLVRSNPAVAAL